MYILVLATTKLLERTPNKLKTEIKQNSDDVGTSIVYCLCHMCRWYLHHRHFVFNLISNFFCVLSIGFAMASTRICIIYWVKFKIEQEISISRILKYKNFQPFSYAAMLGCRYPMVPTSALHQ